MYRYCSVVMVFYFLCWCSWIIFWWYFE